MAEQESKAGARDDQSAAKKSAGTEAEGDQTETAAADQAARRPVRKASSKGKIANPNKSKPAKANAGNRSSRAAREAGANKAADDSGKDEDEEDDEKRAADQFWQLMVAGSYSSRKARGDWGGGESGE